MTNDDTNKLKYSEETARLAIRSIASKADILEQAALNLERIATRRPTAVLQKGLGMEVERDKENDGYKVILNGERLTSYDDNNRQSSKLEDVESHAAVLTRYEVSNIIYSLLSVGRLAHEVHLDRRGLNSYEKTQIAELPNTLQKAERLFEDFARSMSATPKNKELLIQAKRDANLLRQVASMLGDSSQHVVAYNEQMIDRQAELCTKDDIAADEAKKYSQGVQMLGRSDDLADKFNPTFRDRTSRRKPLDVLEETPPKATPLR
jgi:hypothetical protein